MDGPEGEEHVQLGARIMALLFDRPQPAWWATDKRSLLDWVKANPEYAGALYVIVPGRTVLRYGTWAEFTLYHSRYYAKKKGARPSRLCIADKLAIALTPAWLYIPLTRLTGELREYMRNSAATIEDAAHSTHYTDYERACYGSNNPWRWYDGLQHEMARWVAKQMAEGGDDDWTRVRHPQEVA
jgi:hypothetical protein